METDVTGERRISHTYFETRKLATANRSRVSIRGQPCKTFLAASLITMQNLVVLILYAQKQEAPKLCGRWSLWIRGVADPYFPTCVSTPNFVALD